MGGIVRAVIVFLGVIFMLGGTALITGQAVFGVPGLELVIIGGFLIFVVAIERQRYRSAAAEVSNAAPGPGGGEPRGESVDPRFRPTTEQFIDPTTGTRMRVLVDPKTGERRYVAEG